MWTGPVAIKVNNVPHLFSSDLLFFFTVNGPNISNQQWVNGGSLEILSFGTSDIFSSDNLPVSLWHTTHLCLKLLMAELALVIQKLHFSTHSMLDLFLHVPHFYDTT